MLICWQTLFPGVAGMKHNMYCSYRHDTQFHPNDHLPYHIVGHLIYTRGDLNKYYECIVSHEPVKLVQSRLIFACLTTPYFSFVSHIQLDVFFSCL